MRLRPLLPCLLLALTVSANAQAEQVTIYRCTDAQGKQTLRDSPCKRGEKQQTQQMIRPVDAKPAPVTASRPAARANPTQTVRYVMQPGHAPLYRCVTPDGQRYISETADGQPRWQPGWAVGAYPYPYPYPPVTVAAYGDPQRMRAQQASVPLRGQRPYVAGAPVVGAPIRQGVVVPVIATGGYWERDACNVLSTAALCEVLGERRFDIARRYAQAMPSERRVLDEESATLDTRLRQECGT